jgi:hypothetical protein
MSAGTDFIIAGKDFIISDWGAPIIGGILIVIGVGGGILYLWKYRS